MLAVIEVCARVCTGGGDRAFGRIGAGTGGWLCWFIVKRHDGGNLLYAVFHLVRCKAVDAFAS